MFGFTITANLFSCVDSSSGFSERNQLQSLFYNWMKICLKVTNEEIQKIIRKLEPKLEDK